MRSAVENLRAFLLNSNVGRCFAVASTLAIFLMLLQAVLANSTVRLRNSLAFAAFFAVLIQYASLRAFGRTRCYMGTGPHLQRVFNRMPTAKRSPQPPFWAFGPHVQFVPWVIYNSIWASFFPIPFEEERVQVSGLADKSQEESKENPCNMVDSVVVHYFPPVTESTAAATAEAYQLPLDAPVIFVDPGLTCTAQDVPGSSFLRLAVSRGFRTIVIERRGHASPLVKARWNLFGDSSDFEQICARVRQKLHSAPFLWIGISSGSKLITEGLGKFDDRRRKGDKTAPEFVATACLCPGYNLETCFLKFGFLFQKMCLSSVKSKFLVPNTDILREYHAAAYDKAMGAPDLQSLLAHVAPFAGYPSAEAYFAAENPVLFAPLITTPTLIINSGDDPLTVVENAFARMPGQKDGPSFVELLQKSDCGMLLISPSGSHCPFLDGTWWPFSWTSRALGWLVCGSWADACILEFFEGYLSELSRTTAPPTN